MGKWYQDNLGFKILLSAGDDVDGVSFVVDSTGTTVLELGRLPEVPSLEGRNLPPLQLHIAIECVNPAAEAQRLIDAGAELLGESLRNSYQGEKILIRDPWGYTIQLVNRKDKLQEQE